MLIDAYPKDCLIRPGLQIGRYCFGLFGPTVDDVGTLVSAVGGWVAPVRFTSGECALLRSYSGDGAVSVDRIVEWISGSGNAQALLKNSSRLPEVFEGPDPGILYVRVSDIEHEGTSAEVETVYDLHLHGILGHLGEQNKDAVAVSKAAWT
jgi:hypothetical protein